MKSLKNFAKASPEDQARFFCSFDHILFDMDGVIWIAYKALPGAVEFVNSLKKQGKGILYVTNNGLRSTETLLNVLERNQFDADIDELVTPIVTGITYLKKENINKAIFAIGTNEFKQELRKAGFEVYPDLPQQLEEDTLTGMLKHIEDDETVGAVFFNLDFNLTYLKIQKTATFLKRSDCLYINCAGDKFGPAGPLGPIIGNYFNFKCLEEISGRTGTSVSKPSQYLKEFINEKLAISDPKRVLFVGDAILEDMGFAAKSGFQKLLVLSGTATMQDVQCWKYPEECKPEYYVESLDVLNTIFKSLGAECCK